MAVWAQGRREVQTHGSREGPDREGLSLWLCDLGLWQRDILSLSLAFSGTNPTA
jgi:hypothetical protein